MNKVIIGIAVIFGIAILFYSFNNNTIDEDIGDPLVMIEKNNIKIIPITHASAVILWDDTVIYTDPVGGADLYNGQPAPDIILLTDIHGDHLDIDTLEEIVADETVLIVPSAVSELLPAVPGKRPEPLASRVVVLENGSSTPNGEALVITAVPMYNIPESEDAFHTKGRGNGYVIEGGGTRLYVAGDTADIPEMRNLTNIDIALVPMNLPFTMNVARAADAVLEFKPKQVYPYHYRTPDGFSDVAKFKELVAEGDPSIDVVQLEWYPKS